MANGLTDDEMRVIDLAAEIANLMKTVIGDGTSRSGDLNEATIHIHGIQNMVMSQAAARDHPNKFRLLGS